MRAPGLLLAFLLAGCESTAYYGQAIGGHLALMGAARPVEEVIADGRTPPELRERLRSAQRIREFASRQLALPDNGSYRAYAELDRPYAVWNVVAAPELSVQAIAQCFPFAGCVAYRGFYAEARARAHAARLAAAGHDVHVGGVPAYSTLGWFDDPLLSTFIREPDWQLARLLFHELAHQRLYVKGDTTFNESFATVVEDEGVRRWLESEKRGEDLAAFRAWQARRRDFAARVAQAREALAAVYRQDIPREEKLARKRSEFEKLHADYPRLAAAQLNNAFLASVALYNERVPELERLLAESGSLEEFYARAASARSSPGPSSPPRP